MTTKYQVFISSTYDDLKDEREQVIKAVLEMGHIPVGMEMFSAADEEQWQIIARHIEQSDYYIVIVAHRYGSMTEGVSFTEKEYDYAVKQKVPVLGFVIEDDASWPADRVEQNSNKIKALASFKTKVKKKPVSFWRTTKDLYGGSGLALMKAITSNPREGWVRASSSVSPQVTAELSRLSAENATLRSQLEEAEREVDAERDVEISRLMETMGHSQCFISYRYHQERDWEPRRPFSHRDAFWMIAPMLTVEFSVKDACTSMAVFIREDQSRSADMVPINDIKNLFADFMALGLLEPSTRRHSVQDDNEYWSLTEMGKELLKHMRRYSFEKRHQSDNAGGAEVADDVSEQSPVSRGDSQVSPEGVPLGMEAGSDGQVQAQAGGA